jgi:hypothetical protein
MKAQLLDQNPNCLIGYAGHRRATSFCSTHTVTGWCDINWANANKLENIVCVARDTYYDSRSVFANVSRWNHI